MSPDAANFFLADVRDGVWFTLGTTLTTLLTRSPLASLTASVTKLVPIAWRLESSVIFPVGDSSSSDVSAARNFLFPSLRSPSASFWSHPVLPWLLPAV